MDHEGFLKTAAISALSNDELHIQLKQGLQGILHRLVMSGHVQVEYHLGIRSHFERYSFIHCEEETVLGKASILKYSIDMEVFKRSPSLKEYAALYVEDMNKHARKLDKKAQEARDKANAVQRVYLKDNDLF